MKALMAPLYYFCDIVKRREKKLDLLFFKVEIFYEPGIKWFNQFLTDASTYFKTAATE